MWKFPRPIKKRVGISRVIKKVLAFGLGSLMGCSTIFPGLSGEVSFCLEFIRIE